jgi:hypothetical protein
VFRNRILALLLLKVMNRRPVNVTSADIPGPVAPLYLAGARLLEAFPLLPLIGTVSLGVSALSYVEQFNIVVVAGRAAYPDLGLFAVAAQDELRALAAHTRV